MKNKKAPKTVTCINNKLSIGGLESQKVYEIESVSSAGYLWLKEPNHASGRIGPYLPSRFKESA